ncbi:MAG: sodium-independent anion transporter, partial [Clostridia bacterium]
THALVLRMHSVSAMDATALQSIEKLFKACREQHIELILSHVMPQPLEAMQKAGFDAMLGQENLCASIDEALQRAKQVAQA